MRDHVHRDDTALDSYFVDFNSISQALDSRGLYYAVALRDRNQLVEDSASSARRHKNNDGIVNAISVQISESDMLV